MSAGEATFNGFRRSLTGFDEMFITKEFGKPWAKLGEDDPTLAWRAFIAVDLKRGGEKDPRNAALSLTQGEVEDWFLDEDPEGSSEEDILTGEA